MKRLLLIPLIILLVGCDAQQNQDNTPNQTVQQQEVRYFKHIPVKITKIQQTYYYKGTFQVFIEYESDEYGLKKSVTIGNNQDYSYECVSGKYKVGDTIQAMMYTWQQGDTVTRRELGSLDYN